MSVRYETKVRVGLVSLVILGAVLVPLAMEVHWRTEQPTRGFAQPEVPVIERAATDIVKFGTPYQSYWRNGRLVNPVPHIPSYESFFPYFPLMSVFGLPHAEASTRSPLSDARVVMTMMTLLTGGAALFLLRATRRQKIRSRPVLARPADRCAVPGDGRRRYADPGIVTPGRRGPAASSQQHGGHQHWDWLRP